MVDAANGTKRTREDLGFHDAPPRESAAARGDRPPPAIRGWDDAAMAEVPPIGLVFTGASGEAVLAPAKRRGDTRVGAPSDVTATLVGQSRRFTDLASLTVEIFRLKKESTNPAHDSATRAALSQQIVMRQSEWVGRAKASGLREPTAALDAMGAKPAEVASAFMWSEAGGVVPRAELERDGGRAFRASVRDAMTLRMSGFDALLELHRGRPNEQRALLVRSLRDLGIPVPAGDPSIETLRALREETLLSRSTSALRKEREEARRQVYIGLDGYVGTAERLDRYEREHALAAANPGSTLGSILATYVGSDTERARAWGQIGDTIERVVGAATTPAYRRLPVEHREQSAVIAAGSPPPPPVAQRQ